MHYRGQCSGLAEPAAGDWRRNAKRAGSVRTGGREPAFDALGFAQRHAVAGFRALGTGNPGGFRPVLGDLPGCSLGIKVLLTSTADTARTVASAENNG